MADEAKISRRSFIHGIGRGLGLLAVGTGTGLMIDRASGDNMVWQIDPDKCVHCGKCQTHCVLAESAVKCVHVYAMCGYCQLCTGFFVPDPYELTSAAENQLCPTNAIGRRFIEDPYYEYSIDDDLCIGCAKCVKGCEEFGNGSLFLQVRHNRCVNCNQCTIALACPSRAFVRVPASEPYLLKGEK